MSSKLLAGQPLYHPSMPAIIPLTPSGLPRASRDLARAFHDDPVFVWALPDAERRARVLPAFFAAVTRVAMYANETYTTTGSVDESNASIEPSTGSMGRRRSATARARSNVNIGPG